MHLYVFPDAVRRAGNEKIKLNTDGKKLVFFYNDDRVIIDTEALREGSSTLVLHNYLTKNTYALYNFREICQALDMTTREFLCTICQPGYMQIDKCEGDLFIKVFLPEGELQLDSDTDDFSLCRHLTKDMIHPLDWKYSWTLDEVEGRLEGDTLYLTLAVTKSAFWKREVYISHAGQTEKVRPGMNTYAFKYVEGEDAYLGEPCCRYKGRAIDLARLLRRNNDV